MKTDLTQLAERGAAELDGASADDLLRWTDENFGGNYIVASNMQDAVLVDLAAKVRPGVDVLFLDTGYHFVETIGTRDAVEAVYDINVVNVTPENSVAKQDELFGKDLFAREASECCRMRKVEPLSKALRGYSAWVTGIRRVEAPDARQRAADQLGQGIRAGEDQPDRGVVRRGHAELHRRQRCPGQSPCLRGLSVDRLRAVHGQAGRGRRPAQRPLGGPVQDGMRAARVVTLVSGGARQRRPAFGGGHACGGGPHPAAAALARRPSRVPRADRPEPARRAGRSARRWSWCRSLLADAYHARVDIPEMIEDSGAAVEQAEVLGEDPALLSVLRQRLAEIGVSPESDGLGVLVVAVGSSNEAANARTSNVAHALSAGTRWAGAEVAFATGPQPSVAEAADRLRARGATALVIAPWFLAHGIITDRVAAYAAAQGIPMAEPLGSHNLVAATVLDRFDAIAAASIAA